MSIQTQILVERKSLSTARIITFAIAVAEGLACLAFPKSGLKSLPMWPYAMTALLSFLFWIYLLAKIEVAAKHSRFFTVTALSLALVVATFQNINMPYIGVPYQAFLGHKFIALVTGIVAPSLYWYGLILIGLCGIIPPLTVFFIVPIDLRHLILPPEPWASIITAFIGAIIFYHRNLELKYELTAMEAIYAKRIAEHRAATFIAIRDLVSTPLQTLILAAGILREKYPQAANDIDRIDASVNKMLELRKQLDGQQTKYSPDEVSPNSKDYLERT
jgi:hypothetical protein